MATDTNFFTNPRGYAHYHTLGSLPGVDGPDPLAASASQLFLPRLGLRCILLRRIHELELDPGYFRGLERREDHNVGRCPP